MKLHRNSQKRFYGLEKIYFVVTKTFQNYPYFKEPIFCDLLIKELRLCKKMKQFELLAFCLIYDHLNLLLKPNKKFDISKVMQSIKKESSRDINRVMGNNNNEGDIPECRLQMGSKLRVVINDYRQKFIKKYGKKQYDFPIFKWQKSFHDHIIRGEKDFNNHYVYTVYNYKKHDLPDNWRYTSLNYGSMVDNINL